VQIAELRFGDVGRGLSHYRPVVVAVAAIAVMGLTLPGPKRVAANLFGASNYGGSTAAASLGAADASVPEAAATAEVAAAVDAIDSAPGTFGAFSASPSSASTGSSFGIDAAATRADASTTDTFESSAPATTQPKAATAQPLIVTKSAWASAQAGTPLAATGVPEGALPVGRRPGFAQDKVAFIRLAGGATSISLVPHADATGQRSAETAQIQACRITTPGWAAGQAVAMADAPKWDCAVSVLGARAADGRWTFDLSVFPDRVDDRGFALVPAGDAVDFQVAFTIA
jgi:hypothetical protein